MEKKYILVAIRTKILSKSSPKLYSSLQAKKHRKFGSKIAKNYERTKKLERYRGSIFLCYDSYKKTSPTQAKKFFTTGKNELQI